MKNPVARTEMPNQIEAFVLYKEIIKGRSSQLVVSCLLVAIFLMQVYFFINIYSDIQLLLSTL